MAPAVSGDMPLRTPRLENTMISYSAHSSIHLTSQPLRHQLLQFWFAHKVSKKLLVEFHALNITMTPELA